MKFIAHRGACLEAQEDTLDALEKASSYGAFAVECDPRYTKDGVLVVFHDNDLRRLASDERRIDELTFEEMKSALAKVGKTVNTFNEIVESYRGGSAVLFDLSFEATDESFFRELAEKPLNSVVGVHDPREAELARRWLPRERVLAFMKHPEDIDEYVRADVGNIRLWEHWLGDFPIAEARKHIPPETEIWIMSCDKSIHHPLFCMNGSPEQIEKLISQGADAMLLNDIAAAKKYM